MHDPRSQQIAGHRPGMERQPRIRRTCRTRRHAKLAVKSNDAPPFDFAPPEDIPIDDDVCMDEWTAEAAEEPPTGNGHDPDPADAGKLIPDREVLLQFVALMFKNADTRGYVSLRAFKDNDKRDEGPIFTDPIRLNDPDFAAILFERARQAATWDDLPARPRAWSSCRS